MSSAAIGQTLAPGESIAAGLEGYMQDIPSQSLADTDILHRFLVDELPYGAVGAVRPIKRGDECLLTAVEAEPVRQAIPSVKRASGTGRDLARRLCAQIGTPVMEIPRSPRRFPLWPAGVLGSITHDAQLAAATVAPAERLGGLGIDIEPACHLHSDIRAMIGTPEELANLATISFGAKALFSIKEAVFKAVYPSDQIFLDFPDVSVDLRARTAITQYGRTVQWRVMTVPHVLAIAWW